MRFRVYILLLFSIIYSRAVVAQVKDGNYTQSRVLILLDRSSSMIQKWGNAKSKAKAADDLILRLMDSVYQVNPFVEFSLRVFGHQYTVPENNCQDTKNEVPFAKDNRTRMAYRLEDIQPLGVTSIAYSLKQAAQYDLVEEAKNAYSILLITDGGESCGGDICDVMRTLVNNKVYFKPYIISLEDYAPLRATYACMGSYLQVLKESDMRPAIGVIVDAFRPMLEIKAPDEKIIKKIIASAPSVLKVNTPAPVVTPPPPPPPPPAPAPVVIAKMGSIARLGVTMPRTLQLLPVASTKAPLPVIVPVFEPKIDAPAPVEPPKPVAVAEPKPVRPEPQKIARLANVKMRMVEVGVASSVQPTSVAVPVFEAKVVEEAPPAPVRPAPQKIGYATLARLRLLPAAITTGKAAVTVAVPEPPAPVIRIDTPAAPKVVRVVDKIERLQPLKTRQFGIIWVVEEHSFPMHAVPPVPDFKFDAPPAPKPAAPAKPTAATKPATPAVPQPEGNTADYKIDRTEAKETTLQVYFTNGKGKFYTTTPQIVLTDDVTGKVAKKFYRFVDANGNPDPQPGVPPGSYNLTFSETRGTIVRNVKIEEHKNNKVVVTVPPASLSFAYAGAPGRPVTEFTARVIERNKPQGRVQDQKCTDRLEYEAGNYHVIINTFPQDVRNLDLEFAEKEIAIPQPGFANFSADASLTSVILYQHLGDKFLSFHTLNPNDPKNKHLSIQPGEYQAHYRKGPGGPGASEKVVTFIIRPTAETVIELK